VTLWRISDHLKLDGGGLLAPRRWHTQGWRVVYCAPNPATSLVEVLVHIEVDSDDLSDTLQYLEIEAPDDISTEKVEMDALGRNWQANPKATRRDARAMNGSAPAAPRCSRSHRRSCQRRGTSCSTRGTPRVDKSGSSAFTAI
jgi:RES domain-containing protein